MSYEDFDCPKCSKTVKANYEPCYDSEGNSDAQVIYTCTGCGMQMTEAIENITKQELDCLEVSLNEVPEHCYLTLKGLHEKLKEIQKILPQANLYRLL